MCLRKPAAQLHQQVTATPMLHLRCPVSAEQSVAYAHTLSGARCCHSSRPARQPQAQPLTGTSSSQSCCCWPQQRAAPLRALVYASDTTSDFTPTEDQHQVCYCLCLHKQAMIKLCKGRWLLAVDLPGTPGYGVIWSPDMRQAAGAKICHCRGHHDERTHIHRARGHKHRRR